MEGKSLARGSKKILIYWKWQEYSVVALYKNNLKTNFYVHRLVAENFIDNPKNLPIVNHKDFNKKNNFLSISFQNLMQNK